MIKILPKEPDKKMRIETVREGVKIHVDLGRGAAAKNGARLPHNPTLKDFAKALRLFADWVEALEK